MIYLIGGGPRVGKSILCQWVSAKLKVGWISTDLLVELLRVKRVEGVKTEWNAAPEAINPTLYLRFVASSIHFNLAMWRQNENQQVGQKKRHARNGDP